MYAGNVVRFWGDDEMDRLSVTSRKMVTYTRVDCVGASKVIFEYKAFSKIFLCEPKYFYLFKIKKYFFHM